MQVVGEDGRELPYGEIGEIVTRSDCVMRGYWRNPEGNARALRDGWLWTGDVGAMESDGFVTIRDRSKDMIISGGSNIYPREIEEVLLSHPAVLETAVVARPHADWGEEVIAFVVKRGGATVDAPGARQPLPGKHRPLQAAEGLSLRRQPAQEQLRKNSQDRAARAAETGSLSPTWRQMGRPSR